MATTISNNLYPPVVSTWMPAFERHSSCKVYFSLSKYNNVQDILNAQVMVNNQNSSLSALRLTPIYTSDNNIDENYPYYPSGIKICDIQGPDLTVSGDAQYYIEIEANDINGNDGFALGEYYKVQIRFTSVNAASPPSTGPGLAEWLQSNNQYFSEWSTVCLIRGIAQSSIYFKEFGEADNQTLVTFVSNSLTLTGQLLFAEEDEDEYLKSYKVEIYEDESNELIYTSGDIFTNEFYPNEINYVLNCNLEMGINYRLEFFYVTNNQYSNTIIKIFNIEYHIIDLIDAWVTTTADNENGRIQVHIEGKTSAVWMGNLCIRRTSDQSDFNIWEDVHIEALQNPEPLNYDWYDYTIQSGILYYYCILQIRSDGTRGAITKSRSPVLAYFDDIFLTRADMQLRIRLNPNITSYKVTLSESKTETLGAQYPYFLRNGNIAYKQFTITGLIHSFCDEDQLFSSKEEFYKDETYYYQDFNDKNLIPEYADYIYEKRFRDKIINFLYQDNVKLFRSLTEGNILVKLMDISFTPNQTLGRMIYDFSATAYEIDECSIANFINYGILNMNEYQNNFDIDYYNTIPGELADTIMANENAITRIIDKYENNAIVGYTNIITSITGLRLDFQSRPYLIISDNKLTPASATDKYSDNTVYGYIAIINGESILINPRGYYAADFDIPINSLSFPVDTEVNIDFTINLHGQKNTNQGLTKQIGTTYFYNNIGQLYGNFEIYESLSHQIYSKYYIEEEKNYQRLISINEITVEADPGTIIYVKDAFDDGYYKHIVGTSHILNFYDADTIISAFYFGGIQLIERKKEIDQSSDNEYYTKELYQNRITPEIDEFYDTGIIVPQLSLITNPIEHFVYTVSLDYIPAYADVAVADMSYVGLAEDSNQTQRYIYLYNNWYEFTDDNIALCPVEAIINYSYELEKGEYL